MDSGHPANLSLRLLRAFVAVCKEGHVGRAAAALFVSQPSLSQDIRRLEREVGTRLFERQPRGLSLTAAGEDLFRGVQAGLALIDRSFAQAQLTATGARPSLTIGYSPSVGNKLMPALLPLLEQELGTWEIDDREVDTGEVGPGVLAGRFDAGLAHCPAPHPGLTATHLVDEPLCVALSASHPLASRTHLRLDELGDSALLIWPRDSAPEYYDRILGLCFSAGLRPGGIKETRRAMVRSYLLDDNRTFSLLPASIENLRIAGVRFLALEASTLTVPLVYLRRTEDDRTELGAVEALSRQVGRTLTHEVGPAVATPAARRPLSVASLSRASVRLGDSPVTRRPSLP
jgi:DNA-binding transcriptional LysR family regulator